ncbi:MAG: alginate lyase family protein [Betaproteobacteria bacterium]|nr:MAG: alginate lyase family protein [Betaproteobacteria bacterium]
MDASEHRNLAPGVRSGLKDRLRLALNRLRCMTPAELAWRAARALQVRAERARLIGAGEIPSPDLGRLTRPWVHADARVDAARYVVAADRIADGWIDVLALQRVDIGSPPRWNRDPKTGIEAPLAFGKTLDCTDPDVVGDIRYLWHLNRHQHFVTLAQAYALTGRKRYTEAMREHLESWFFACPRGLGANWASALEAALRLVNWSVAWQLVGGAGGGLLRDNAELRLLWMRLAYQHARFIRGWLSLHSAANHRLIGEAAGLFIAGLTWPHWSEARAWLSAGKAILEREALAQVSSDGVHRDQSACYQQGVLDLLVFCLLAGKANGEWFSPHYESRVEAMLDFVASTMDAGGRVPMLGDSDDSSATRLSAEEDFCPLRSALATGAVLFRRGDFKLKAKRLDDKSRWLLGAQADATFAELEAEKTRLPPRQSFPEGGYFVLGCDFDTPNEVRVVADAGPLGAGPAAAHGHADALSFTLSAGGREFLVDPGACAWHGRSRWREYFRGTLAHNTLRVDGLDQSVSGGAFLWLKKARAESSLWLSSAEKDTFEGWHDGYLRLEDPVKHRRLIELDKRARRLVIEDTLEMDEDHEVELLFHCSERCSVENQNGCLRIVREGRAIVLRLPQASGCVVQLYRGCVAPILGWVSRAFDAREAATTIVWQARLAGRTALRTEILIPNFA